MEPISTTLAGIALVQKSVEFIKSNINTVNDIKDIASVVHQQTYRQQHWQYL